MTEENLLIIIQILLLFLAGIWLFIAFSLVYRKHRKAHLEKIELLFAEVTSRYLYPLPQEEPDLIEIQRAFRGVGVRSSRPANVQYLINLMIRTQRSILGEDYHKLETLFKQIPPFRASISKLSSRKWYMKARGIREIYEMDQEQYLKDVIKEIDHKNIFVRREAQIAMVVFLGWDSLRFLPYLKREMTLWQQIKIVEKLHDLYPDPDLTYLRKAYTAEKPYAQELVMRIIRKFRLQDEVDYILHFLDHENFDRRETAIYCISSFELEEHRMKLVKEKFSGIPNIEQRLQLLKYIPQASGKLDVDFFNSILEREDQILKLCAAEILWNTGYRSRVEDYYYSQYDETPEPRSA